MAVRSQAGLIPYADSGFWQPDYVPKDTDVLCAFRITPQPGVPPEEAGAAVAGESSTATGTATWTDRLTAIETYQAKCYRVEPVPGAPGQWIVLIAYDLDLDLFEEGSIASLASVVAGNVFGLTTLAALAGGALLRPGLASAPGVMPSRPVGSIPGRCTTCCTTSVRASSCSRRRHHRAPDGHRRRRRGRPRRRRGDGQGAERGCRRPPRGAGGPQEAATHNRPLEMALARRTEVASDHEPTDYPDFPTSRLPDYPDVTATPANV